MKKCAAMLLFLLVLLTGAAAEEIWPDNGYWTFPETELPESLRASLDTAGFSGAQVIDGAADRRFGTWMYAELIVRDDAGDVLIGGLYEGEDTQHWLLTASRTALRQGEAARIVCEGEKYGYTADDVSQMGACMSFELVYPDATYFWFLSTAGWRLFTITTAQERLDVNKDSVALIDEQAGGAVQTVYCDLPVTLEDFDIMDYPTRFEELARRAETLPQSDRTQARLCHTRDEGDEFFYDDEPPVLLYAAPDTGSRVVARSYSGVNAEALEERGDWVRLRIGGVLEAWARRRDVLLGGERAHQFDWGGQGAQVYTVGAQRTQPVYAQADEGALVLAELEVFAGVSIQAILEGGDWLLVEKDGDVFGYMRGDAVSEADNYYDAWIYSEDPALRLNLREQPDKGSRSLGKYYSGVHVIRLNPEKPAVGWTKVIIEGVSGWVQSQYLDFDSCYNGREWLPPIGVVQGVNSKGLNLRAEPSGEAEVLGAYPKGTRVEILGVTGAWGHVRLRDGSTGYMMLKYLGGEPKRAAENSFALRGDVQLGSAGTNAQSVTLRAGTRVRIAERPHGAWYYAQRTQEDGEGWQVVFGEQETIWVAQGESVVQAEVSNLALDW